MSMPSLDDLLEQTMYRYAIAGIANHEEERTAMLEALAKFPMDSPGDAYVIYKLSQSWAPLPSIWSWQQDGSNPAVVKDVRCSTPHGSNQLVCKEIRWSAVKVKLGNHELLLDLSNRAHLLDAYTHEKPIPGKVYYAKSGARKLYLEADVDRAILLVYGFVIDPLDATAPIKPFSDEDKERCRAPDFLPEPPPWYEKHRKRAASVVKKFAPFVSDDQVAAISGNTNTFAVRKLRVIVATELVACHPRADFSPSGFLGGVVKIARLYPHTFVWCSEPVDGITTDTRLQRPGAPEPSLHHHTNFLIEKFSDKMNDDMAVLVTAEQNGDAMSKVAPDLEWDNIFSYYDDNIPTTGPDGKPAEYVVVDPHRGPRTSVAYRWGELNVFGPSDLDIDKVAGQGAFDNVHISPTMNFGALRYVRMAPYCIHDCLHIHWRWGTKVGEDKHLLGWGGGLPYREPGAPMVPPNQRVTVSFIRHAPAASAHVHDEESPVPPGAVTFIYKAATVGPVSPFDGWQMFFHHGCGYAYQIGTLYDILTKYDNIWDRGFWTNSWTTYYWSLRYLMRTPPLSPRERLRWTKSDNEAENARKRDEFRDL